MTATIVLVHGAWHGGWCFEPVLQVLDDAGLDAIALDLPGHAENDTAPVGDLRTDAAHVTRALDELDREGRGEVVLLGHSYGGAVITEVGIHRVVRELVYLAAFALDLGESCASVAPDDPGVAAISHAGRPNLGHAFVAGDDATVTLTRDGAAACLYNGVDAAATEWALDRLSPQSFAALTQSPTNVAWRERPATYITCTEDLAVHPDLQRLMARRCGTSVEWPVGHSPFLSDPVLVADLLIARAHATAPE